MNISKTALPFLVLSLLAVAACQKQATPAPAEQKAAPAEAAAPVKPLDAERSGPPSPGEHGPGMPSPDLPKRDTTVVDSKITDVTLSNQGDTEKNTLGMPTGKFGPQDTVYAQIQSSGTASDYTIYAKWIGADGTVLADYGIKLNQGGLNRTVISLSKPDGWPKGQNRIELAINGSVQRTVPFQVQ